MKKLLLSFTFLILAACAALAQSGEQLRFCLHSEPKTFNPVLMEDDASETVRYLTGGVLLRLNRQTQQLEPELATDWKLSNGGRTITFRLRSGLRFSDGSPFTSGDVKHTMDALMDPAVHSPTGDAFRSGPGKVTSVVLGDEKVSITFPARIAGLAQLFDQVAIVSASSPKKEMAAMGPFYVAEYKPGAYVALRRNPRYWKHDESGHAL